MFIFVDVDLNCVFKDLSSLVNPTLYSLHLFIIRPMSTAMGSVLYADTTVYQQLVSTLSKTLAKHSQRILMHNYTAAIYHYRDRAESILGSVLEP